MSLATNQLPATAVVMQVLIAIGYNLSPAMVDISLLYQKMQLFIHLRSGLTWAGYENTHVRESS